MAIAPVLTTPNGRDALGADADPVSLAARAAIVDDPRRVVRLDTVHNFRDLGGYELGDGRTIAWGRLFRADALYRASDADIEVLRSIGMRTVIDLRSDAELAEHGKFETARHPATYHHLPIIDATWMKEDIPDFPDTIDGSIDFLIWAYRDMLAIGADRFAHAIKVVALPESMPLTFHCAAGKDRTGILAALILAGLGVDHDVVVADYALTAAAMDRMRAWLATNHPAMSTQMGATPSYMLAARPEAIHQILTDLRTDHGSVENYLSTIGIGAAVLESLADQLTDV